MLKSNIKIKMNTIQNNQTNSDKDKKGTIKFYFKNYVIDPSRYFEIYENKFINYQEVDINININGTDDKVYFYPKNDSNTNNTNAIIFDLLKNKRNREINESQVYQRNEKKFNDNNKIINKNKNDEKSTNKKENYNKQEKEESIIENGKGKNKNFKGTSKKNIKNKNTITTNKNIDIIKVGQKPNEINKDNSHIITNNNENTVKLFNNNIVNNNIEINTIFNDEINSKITKEKIDNKESLLTENELNNNKNNLNQKDILKEKYIKEINEYFKDINKINIKDIHPKMKIEKKAIWIKYNSFIYQSNLIDEIFPRKYKKSNDDNWVGYSHDDDTVIVELNEECNNDIVANLECIFDKNIQVNVDNEKINLLIFNKIIIISNKDFISYFNNYPDLLSQLKSYIKEIK